MLMDPARRHVLIIEDERELAALVKRHLVMVTARTTEVDKVLGNGFRIS